jgi:flagellar basal body-associated protein FliL
MENTTEKKSNSHSIIGIVIIVIILIAGGVYIMAKNTQKEFPVVTEEVVVEKLQLSNSDEISEIETDLEKLSNFEDLETEINAGLAQ